MFRNYFKTAFSNFRKNKLFTTINVTGLTVAFTACLLIGVFIIDEFSYDNFQKNGDRIARVTMEYSISGTINSTAMTGTKPGPQFARTFPEVTAYTRTSLGGRVLKIGDQLYDEPKFLYADPSFFELFTFSIIKGNPNTCLSELNNVVITQSTAKKYFGDADPINQIISSGQDKLIVTAVCKDEPENSQIHFDFVAPFLSRGSSVQKEVWFNANWVTYLLLKNKDDFAPLQKKINSYMQSPEVRSEAGLGGANYLKYHLQPYTEVHLHSALAGFEPNGSMQFILMLSAIAILILIIAFANYTNLTISQSASRTGEIGMRKVMGASPKQIFLQFISESGFITVIAILAAFLFSQLLLPYFNQLTGKNLHPSSLLSSEILLSAFVFVVLFSLMSGLYPALILSGKKTISMLKKGFTFTGGNPVLRKGLIVAQFAISVFLIIYTLVILQQMNYLQKKNVGYNRENVISVPIGGSMHKNVDLIEDAFKNTTGVQSITRAYETPEDIQWGDGVTAIDEKGKYNVSVNAIPVGLDFLTTLDMHLVAGRSFLKSDFAGMDTADNNKNYHVPFILNETLASKLGWEPEVAIGKTLDKGFTGQVVGVVKDFNYQSLHQPIGPLLIFLDPEMSNVFLIRIKQGQTRQTLTNIEDTWKDRITDRPFTYEFLDQNFALMYKTEMRSSIFLTVAAGLGIFLACLGLFGLAAFTITKRKKEISIRKVLGANTGNIILTLSKGFMQLVAIAIIIAIPISWIAGNHWLNNFAFRTQISIWVIAITAILTASIAFVTLSIQAIKTSRLNPAETLKSE